MRIERRISTHGPVQKDGSILIAVYDTEETHDILVNPVGTLRSENIWGGYLAQHRCDDCNGYFEQVSRYDWKCSDCGKRFYDCNHCLIYDYVNDEVYEGNRHITHFTRKASEWKEQEVVRRLVDA